MTIRDIVVLLDSTAGTAARLDLALGLAQRHDAHLVGLHVVPPPDFAYMGSMGEYTPASMIDALIREYEEKTQAQAKQIEARFHEAARREGVVGEWRSLTGDPTAEAAAIGRCADLLIVGQPEPDSTDMSVVGPAEITLICGRPVLVVPYVGGRPGLGKRVLVAWDGGREAARAVNDAIPLMADAELVTILSIEEAQDTSVPAKPLASEDIALHLARHGIKAQAEVSPSGYLPAGELLLSRASELGADLIVMGCYGHSRLRELVLGGATRTIEQTMTVPTLFSH